MSPALHQEHGSILAQSDRRIDFTLPGTIATCVFFELKKNMYCQNILRVVAFSALCWLAAANIAWSSTIVAELTPPPKPRVELSYENASELNSVQKNGAEGPSSSPTAKKQCRVDRIGSLLNSKDRLGYGANTTGGAAAEVITWVTNLNDSGRGSLRDALSTPSPKWIAFDDTLRGGTIYLDSPLIPAGDFTLDGRGSSGPLGITISPTVHATHIMILWHGNVIIHGVNLDGNNTKATALMPRTGSNFWFDHITATNWALDDALALGKLSLSNSADNITISNYHAHSTAKAILFGGEDQDQRPKTGKLTVFNSILAADDRNPMISRHQHAHVFNNYVHSFKYEGIQALRGAVVFAENNYVSAASANSKLYSIAGANWESTYPNGIMYSKGNIVIDGNEWNVTSQPYDIPYDYTTMPAEEVVDYVVKNAGAENSNLSIEVCD